MNPIKIFNKTFFTTSIATAMAISGVSAFAKMSDDKVITYTDPVSGELRVAPKLLSEMSENEKARLSDQQREELEQIEKMLKKEVKKPE